MKDTKVWLVILTVKGSGAIIEVEGVYRTYAGAVVAVQRAEAATNWTREAVIRMRRVRE